jgi:hypothetical protein
MLEAAAMLAISPVAMAAPSPPPPLDIEALFPPNVMKRVRLSLAYASELFTEDERFNISPEFRYALAKLLIDGEDVLCPAEPENHQACASILSAFGKFLGPIVHGYVGELAEPPYPRMMLLTRDWWVMDLARGGYVITPFRAYHELGFSETETKRPTRAAPPRPGNLPPPVGRYISMQELYDLAGGPRQRQQP